MGFRQKGRKIGVPHWIRKRYNLYRSDRSLCPLCLCGSFHPLASFRIYFTQKTQENPRFLVQYYCNIKSSE